MASDQQQQPARIGQLARQRLPVEQPTITSSSLYLGAAMHNGELAAGAKLTGIFTGVIPAVALGNYYFVVQADSIYQVSDPNRTNNVCATTTQVAVSVPALTLGAPQAGSFSSAGQDVYYQITVPASGALQIALDSAASAGAALSTSAPTIYQRHIRTRWPAISRTNPIKRRLCRRFRQRQHTTSSCIAYMEPLPRRTTQ